MMRALVGAVLLVMAFQVRAETMYVTDRLSVPLRAAFAEGSPVVKSIDSGSALEVLERQDKYARVRDNQGAEGWVEARYLANAPAARAQLERAQAEIGRLTKELAEAQARIKQLDASLAQESARGVELAKTAEQANAQATQASAIRSAAVTDDATDFSWGWIVLAFAMLWIGFGAGVVWIRERHRKKLGGMYLRI